MQMRLQSREQLHGLERGIVSKQSIAGSFGPDDG